MKKFLSQDIKKYVKFQFKKFLISTYFKQVISNEDNLTSYFFNGFYSKFDYHILKKSMIIKDLPPFVTRARSG